MIDLDKLSALEKAATPGPWYAWLDPNNNIEDKCITTIPEEQYIREYNALCGKRWLESNEEVIGCSEWMRADDADFLLIVEMRNQLPYLLARIVELEKRNADLGAQVTALQEIAVEQKAAHIAFVGFHRNMNEDETKNKAQDEARRQLVKEHPEVFR